MKRGWSLLGAGLDLLVAPSFCSLGFGVREKTWAKDSLEVDLGSKVFIVTGANSGIGKVVARELARRNGGTIAYAQAKRAQVVLSRQWNRQLAAIGGRANVMHPGWVDTPGVLKSLPQFHRVTKAWLRTPEEGADTVIWLAVSPEVKDRGGEFFFDRQARSEYLPGSLMKHASKDESDLWELCEELTD